MRKWMAILCLMLMGCGTGNSVANFQDKGPRATIAHLSLAKGVDGSLFFYCLLQNSDPTPIIGIDVSVVAMDGNDVILQSDTISFMEGDTLWPSQKTLVTGSFADCEACEGVKIEVL